MTKAIIIKMIIFYSSLYGVDPQISLAVARVESNFDSQVVSQTGDYGIFQLQPQSFPGYTIKELKNPYINIPLGIKYLSKIKKQCKYKKDFQWVICYNIGSNYKKRIRYPKLFPYYKKISIAMESFQWICKYKNCQNKVKYQGKQLCQTHYHQEYKLIPSKKELINENRRKLYKFHKERESNEAFKI